MLFFQGEMMGDSKKPVFPTHKGLTVILWIHGYIYKLKESRDDCADFPKYFRV